MNRGSAVFSYSVPPISERRARRIAYSKSAASSGVTCPCIHSFRRYFMGCLLCATRSVSHLGSEQDRVSLLVEPTFLSGYSIKNSTNSHFSRL